MTPKRQIYLDDRRLPPAISRMMDIAEKECSELTLVKEGKKDIVVGYKGSKEVYRIYLKEA